MVSGTGHGGMEACITNLLEPGETIVVGNAGIWGQRVLDMSSRFGAKAVDLKAETGRTLTKDQIAKALREHRPAVLFLCQGESSTGVHQSLAGLGDLCRETGTLLLVDTVCSLGGVPMYADAWGVDAIYSGTQKVLSGPPGGAPLFFGPRAMEKLAGRKTKPISYTWDMNLVGDYWGWNGTRSYHHTGCVSTWYAMREALALVSRICFFFFFKLGFFFFFFRSKIFRNFFHSAPLSTPRPLSFHSIHSSLSSPLCYKINSKTQVGEQGLDHMWSEHRRLHEVLWEGLRSMGLEPFVKDEKERLATVNTIAVPEGIDWAAVIKNSMDKYSVEIAGGLGPSAGKVWRIGIMGYNATDANVALVLDAMRDGLKKQGWKGVA